MTFGNISFTNLVSNSIVFELVELLFAEVDKDFGSEVSIETILNVCQVLNEQYKDHSLYILLFSPMMPYDVLLF